MLREHPDARILAGGTNVLVDMKMEEAQPGQGATPAESLVDITHVRELVGIVEDPAGIRIGAATPIRTLAVSAVLWREYTALAEAAAAFGSTQVAMRGTIGGNICNGSPASDTVPALLAFGAEAILASAQGERVIPVGDLLVGPGKVRLRDGEMLVAVRLPKSVGNAGSAFVSCCRCTVVEDNLITGCVTALFDYDDRMLADPGMAFLGQTQGASFGNVRRRNTIIRALGTGSQTAGLPTETRLEDNLGINMAMNP